MKLIFLDFDGVITTRKTKYRKGDKSAIEALNYIIEQTGAVVVISSTWRFEGLEVCAQNLKNWGFKGKVIDITPVKFDAPRGWEIDAWLKEYVQELSNPIVPNLVILDDDGDIEPWEDNLVRTNPIHGLNMDDAKKAVEMLTI